MTNFLDNQRIHAEHRRYEANPCDFESVIDEDRYMLLAPLRQGSVRVVSDGHVLLDGEVRPGMLRFTAPGERVRVSIKSPAEHLVMLIPGPDMRKILDGANIKGCRRADIIEPLLNPDRLVAQAAKSYLQSEKFDLGHRQLYVDGLTYLMLARLLAGNKTDNRLCSKYTSLSDQQLDQCCQYADAMMTKKVDLCSWAMLFGMPTTEFAKRFHEKTSQSPYAWFMNRRIERAQMLMRHNRKISIAEVALSVGFCSQSHFTEAFRRRVGCSPARWRSQVGTRF